MKSKVVILLVLTRRDEKAQKKKESEDFLFQYYGRQVLPRCSFNCKTPIRSQVMSDSLVMTLVVYVGKIKRLDKKRQKRRRNEEGLH